MLGVTAEGKGRAYCGLDKIREIFEIEGAPVLCPVIDRNRLLESGFTVESRALRQDARTNQLCGCIRMLALQERHNRFDGVDVGLLVFEHGKRLTGKILILLADKTKNLPKSIPTE